MSKEKEEAEGIIKMFNLPYSNHLDDFTDALNRCAIIYVEGIIDEINEMDWEFSTRIAAERLEYWQEVLTILKNK